MAYRGTNMGQAVILVSGALAILLTQLGIPEAAKWACIVGLIGQPLWILATYRAKQWGMWALSMFYTGAWLAGLYTFWIKPLVTA